MRKEYYDEFPPLPDLGEWELPPEPVLAYGSGQKPLRNDLLIIMVYSSNAKAGDTNIHFFLHHALHAAADFLFVDNGNSSRIKIPVERSNVFKWSRSNTCYDIGTYPLAVDHMEKEYKRKYKKFIFMNGSIRGPFLPPWTDACWSDIFVNPINNKVKLSGITYNCEKGERHIQSMLLATDEIGLELMRPHMRCFDKMNDAIFSGEVMLTTAILEKNYEVTVTMASFHTRANYSRTCVHVDLLRTNYYFGANMHPYEIIFIKTARALDDWQIQRYTDWHNRMKYSSYDHCRPHGYSEKND